MRKIILTLFVLILSLSAHATHIVGGEIYYDYLGNNQYKITLKVYRDCYNGIPPLDDTAHIDIFNQTGNVVQSLKVPILVINSIPLNINSSCMQVPNTICVEEGIYEVTVTLPPINGGYYIVYQRCCRNNTILNITNPGGIGATYMEHIPGPEVAFPNSSPRFKNYPLTYLCNGIDIDYDHSAIDPDGDVLVYSLCPALNGLDGCCPIIPTAATPAAGQYCNSPPPSCPPHYPSPPYPQVPYAPPYNGTYPMATNPALAINPTTGYMTGKPTLNGQWVVSVCVSEYRNGELIGVHQREFQFNVVTCTVNVLAALQNQTQKCEGLTVNFTNQSIGATSFFWNFGDPNTLADTSHLSNPSYTYPDTGTYQVTLVASLGNACSDTIVKTFYVYPKFDPQFTPPSGQCITNNSFSFQVTGNYGSYTTFNWNFGSAATPSVSNLSAPNNVHFSSSGVFPITVTVTQQPCEAILSGTIEVYPTPQIDAATSSGTTCVNMPFQFEVSASNLTNPTYEWHFSNGLYSSESAPVVSFTLPGVYGYSLNIINPAQCVTTLNVSSANAVTVYPNPSANFIFTPTITTIFDPEITFIDSSYNSYEGYMPASNVQWNWDLGDGNTMNTQNFIYAFSNYGEYDVSLIVTNNYGCKDTITKKIKILPEFRFWVPNAFTPTGDGLNEVFLPIVIGVEEYELEIFDRWGEKLFRTNNPKQGWDGYYKGKPCKEDIYVWKISFKNVISRRFEEHVGHVTLLR